MAQLDITIQIGRVPTDPSKIKVSFEEKRTGRQLLSMIFPLTQEGFDMGQILRFKGLLHFHNKNSTRTVEDYVVLSKDLKLKYLNGHVSLEIVTNEIQLHIPIFKESFGSIDAALDELVNL